MPSIYQGLTVCIFTKDRHYCLDRVVNFYEGFNVIIADGSEHQWLDSAKYRNVKYVHMPNIPITTRIKFLAEVSDTKYLVYVADDDILDVMAVSQLISNAELETTDVSVITGDVMAIHWGLIPSWRKLYSYTRETFDLTYLRSLNNREDLRLPVIFNAVWNRKQLLEFFRLCPDLIWRCSFAFEIVQFIYAMSLNGVRYYRLPFLYRNKYQAHADVRVEQLFWTHDEQSWNEIIAFVQSIIGSGEGKSEWLAIAKDFMRSLQSHSESNSTGAAVRKSYLGCLRKLKREIVTKYPPYSSQAVRLLTYYLATILNLDATRELNGKIITEFRYRLLVPQFWVKR